MFRRLSELGLGDPSEIFYSRIFPGRIANIEELQFRLRRYFQRHLEETEDEQIKEDDSNPNFMLEKDINFRLYPFYINWKKLEANESGYYRIFVHFGYFGAAIYSSFKEKYPSLDVNNILYVLASFVSEYLLSKDSSSEASQKLIKEFFEKMPKIDNLCEIIEKKIMMMKEVSMILLVLKIYEIYFMLNKKNEEVEKILKYEYLLGTYLNDNEYKDIYKNHYRGKISKTFKKLVETNGKEYELPKTKDKYFNHIKLIYKQIKSGK
jgi:hypothetical protein